MTATTLQASLSFKPLSLSPSFSSSSQQRRLGISVNHRFCRRRLPGLIFNCTLRPESSLSNSSDLISDSSPEIAELVAGDGSSGQIPRETEPDEAPESSGAGENVDLKRRLPVVVFLMGLFAWVKKWFEKLLKLDKFNWVLPWDHSKRLDLLTAEADANPNDAAKQSALMAELNKHNSPELVIKRFEERTRAVDNRGVAEYLRALVCTNAIAEYLPDENSGKSDNVPSLLEDLIQRAWGNLDEPFVNPGVSEKQPLYVVMVDPVVSKKFFI